MNSAPRLSEGAFEKILSGQEFERPVLQILAQKNVSADSVQRYRFLLSDGRHSYQCCIMVGGLVARIEAGEFERYTVVRLNKYQCNQSNAGSKRVLIMVEPEVITPGQNIGRKIGNPMPYENSAGAADTSMATLATGVHSVSSSSDTSANGGFKGGFKSGAAASRTLNGGPKQADYSMADVSIKEEMVCPIGQINPYQNRWAIRGRVTNKGPIKSWNNAKGEGTLFSFNLADDSGEIRITAFRAEVDKYHDMLQIGKVYMLTKAMVKQANKKWSDLEHDYELTLHGDSIIIPADEHDGSCPQINFNFIKIGQLSAIPADGTVDIVGVCRDPGELTTIQSKNTGKELKKRDISLVDDSENEVRLTIWNSEAENFNCSTGSVVVAKKARVSEYNGKTLTTGATTLIQVDPDLPEAQELRGWYERRGADIEPISLSGRSGSGDSGEVQTLNVITRENVVASPNALQTVVCKATVTVTGKASIYLACPDGCKKKLIEMNNGFYKCDKCNKDIMAGEHRMLLSFCISDCSHSIWATAFHEEAEKLLGMTAKELADLKEQNEELYDETVRKLNFDTYQFKLRSKIDNYKEESRIRSNILSIAPVQTVDYIKKLIKDINELMV